MSYWSADSSELDVIAPHIHGLNLSVLVTRSISDNSAVMSGATFKHQLKQSPPHNMNMKDITHATYSYAC